MIPHLFGTQAAARRHLQVLSLHDENIAVEVCLCEDDHLAVDARPESIRARSHTLSSSGPSEAEITTRLPDVINFTNWRCNSRIIISGWHGGAKLRLF